MEYDITVRVRVKRDPDEESDIDEESETAEAIADALAEHLTDNDEFEVGAESAVYKAAETEIVDYEEVTA